MRRVILYWDKAQIQILEEQLYKLKCLRKHYFELVIQDSVPPNFSCHSDYIRLVSSSTINKQLIALEEEYDQQKLKNPSNLFHRNLLSTIVYCLSLNTDKKEQILHTYTKYLANQKNQHNKMIHITNDFNDVLKNILFLLGYDQKQFIPSDLQEKGYQNTVRQQNRFNELIQNKKLPELVPICELRRNLKNIDKIFTLQYEIQKTPFVQLKVKLEEQLIRFFKTKKVLMLEKQFIQIRQSSDLKSLCRACIYFYTLEKLQLYQNLNFILRSIKSTTFEEQFQNLKLYTVLLILNFYFAYNGQQSGITAAMYRYSETSVNEQMINQVITVPSFYSISKSQELPTFATKQTKFVITPLSNNSLISLKSLFPVHKYSAYKQEQQYLYLPFTCFYVLHVKKIKKKDRQITIVYLRQLSSNPVINKIIDANLPIKQWSCVAEWQLLHQQRYEATKNIDLKMRVSYNLGLVHYQYYARYHIAQKYFEQALNIVKSNPNIFSAMQISKVNNCLGLVSSKLNKLMQSSKYFKQALEFNHKKTEYNEQDINKMNHVCSVMNNLAAFNQHKYEQKNQNKYKETLLEYSKILDIITKYTNKYKYENQLLIACLHNNIGTSRLNLIKSDTKIQLQGWKQCEQQFMLSLKKYANYYALSIPQMAIDRQQKLPNIIQLVPVLENLAQLYSIKTQSHENPESLAQSHKSYKEAIFCQREAIRIYKQGNIVSEDQSSTLFYMSSALAILLNKSKKCMESIKIYQGIIPLAKAIDDTGRISATINMNIGSIYFEMDSQNLSKNLQKALQFYDQAITEISHPLLNQNLDIYNQICDLRSQIRYALQGYNLNK